MNEPPSLSAYETMDTKDKQSRRGFALRLASGERIRLRYPDVHLTRVSGDETVMAVFCYSVNIVIYGRYLKIIEDAFKGEHVAWLQEFDVARWSQPAPDSLLIERIAVYAKKDESGPQADKSEAKAESRARN